MTHAELVLIASKQLTKWRCLPVCTELSTQNSSGEIPDAIGWLARCSILIECKVTRRDFLKDRGKIFRYDLPTAGMGDFRFYFTPPGVIKEAGEIPAGWGVYEVTEDGRCRHVLGVKYANAVSPVLAGNKVNEIIMLRSYIRRTEK